MNLIEISKNHIEQIVNSLNDMNVLLLDKETVKIVRNLLSKSELMDICLFDLIENERERIEYLKCICYIRPSNIKYLINELRNPKYREYHIYISNTITNQDIALIAQSDIHELVRDIQEYYFDYMVIDKRNFVSDINGLISLLMSTRLHPKIIHNIGINITHDLLNPRDTQSAMLIIDRSDDMLTPLMVPESYIGMIHEIYGIENDKIGNILLNDEFFKKYKYCNYKQMGEHIKTYTNNIQNIKYTKNINNINDIKNIKELIRKKKISEKHIKIISKLYEEVTNRKIVEPHNINDFLIKSNEINLNDTEKIRFSILNNIKVNMNEETKNIVDNLKQYKVKRTIEQYIKDIYNKYSYIIVYVVGGVTYDELIITQKYHNVIIGSDKIININTFIKN